MSNAGIHIRNYIPKLKENNSNDFKADSETQFLFWEMECRFFFYKTTPGDISSEYFLHYYYPNSDELLEGHEKKHSHI